MRIFAGHPVTLVFCGLAALIHSTIALQVLQLRECYQSSTFDGDCSKAIDGNFNQNHIAHRCSHTRDAKGWWVASTDKPAHIMEVKIFNRQDCCPERLNNFVITVDGSECASYNSGSPFSVMIFKCDRIGQSVMIKNRIATALTLCEVQVFGEYVFGSRTPKLELRECYQSSTFDGACSKAIDGNFNQNHLTHRCSHTLDAKGWWVASTDKPAHIREVKIFNRLDCCPERLNNFAITVDGQECASYQSETPFSVITFKCDKVGQSVMIKNRMVSALTLCEVEVFGEYVSESKIPKLRMQDCMQSTTFDGDCSKAIDGNFNQNHLTHRCSHTLDGMGWWRANTSKPAHIREVKIFNRLDCCPERLNNFAITVDGQECASYQSETPFSVITFKCDKVGQSVMIKNRMHSALTLCEVQVFGEDRPNFKFIGCYVDNADSRDLQTLEASDQMSPKKCNSLCASRGTAFFALQSGTQCWCGDNYGSNGVASENDCQMACSGDSAEKCGGNFRNAIYNVDKSHA